MSADGERTLRIVALSLAITAIAVWLMSELAQLFTRVADVLLVFIFAWALAYLLVPPVTWLESRLRFGRLGATVVVYVAFILVLVVTLALAVPAIAGQLSRLVEHAPSYGDTLAKNVQNLQNDLDARGIRLDLVSLYGALPERMAVAAAAVAADALTVLGGLVSLLLNLTLVAIVAFFMLVDGDRLWRELVRVLPHDLASEAELLRLSADRSFGGFLRGQLLLGFAYGLIVWLALGAIGVNFALLLGVVSGLLMIIPFFGAIVATFPPVIVALTQSPLLALSTFVVIFVVQFVMTNVVGPKLMSQTVGIHPLFVFAALLLGARLAGFWGVFLALPIAGVLNVFTRYLLQLTQGQRTRTEAAAMLAAARGRDEVAP